MFPGLGSLLKKGRLVGMNFKIHSRDSQMRRSMQCLRPKEVFSPRKTLNTGETLYFNRYSILAKCRELDHKREGALSKEAFCKLIESLNIPGIDSTSLSAYLEGFEDSVDYRKVISFLSREGKHKVILKKEQVEAKERSLTEEIELLKIIVPQLQSQTFIDPSIELSIREIQTLLRHLRVVMPVETVKQVIAKVEPAGLNVKDIVSALKRAKVKQEDFSSEDIAQMLSKLEKTWDLEKLRLMSHEELTKAIGDEVDSLEIKVLFDFFGRVDWKKTSDGRIEKMNKFVESKRLSRFEAFFKMGEHKIIEKDKITLEDFSSFLKDCSLGRTEVKSVFEAIDANKDGIIDVDEWGVVCKSVYTEGDYIKRIIREKALTNAEVEGLLDLEYNEEVAYETVRNRLTRLQKDLPDYIAKALFHAIKEGKYSTLFKLKKAISIEERAAFKTTRDSVFLHNFKQTVKKSFNFSELLALLEGKDKMKEGVLHSRKFFEVLSSKIGQYPLEDVELYLVKKQMIEGVKVDYTAFLQDIFDDFKREYLNRLIECVKEEGIADGSIEFVYSQAKAKLPGISRHLVCMLDVDRDGVISREDLDAVVSRHDKTYNFRLSNIQNNKIALKSNISISEREFTDIVYEIKNVIEREKLGLEAVFKLFDPEGQGVITIENFCENINKLMKISPAIREAVFNRFDILKTRQIDKKTFFSFFLGKKTGSVDWDIERKILEETRKYFRKNANLSNIELFSLLDTNSDGQVDIADFRLFAINKLKFTECKVTSSAVQRVLQELSNTKEKSISLGDLKKEIEFNRKWVKTAVNKLGMVLTKRFDNLEHYFRKYSEGTQLKLESFLKSTESFKEWRGDLALTREDMVCVFSSIDKHKKGYVTLNDLKNRAGDSNFSLGVRKTIRNHIKSCFSSSFEAFRFFLKGSKDIEDKELLSFTLSKSEIMAGLNRIFSKKFALPDLVSFFNSEFKGEVSFKQFSQVFFENQRRKANTGLKTKFDYDPLEKIKRLIRYSKIDCNTVLRIEEQISNGWVNEAEFKNVIKRLNLGLTTHEIEAVMGTIEKNSAGKLNLKEFNKFALRDMEPIEQIKGNLKQVLASVKHKIYKYYGNPRAFFLLLG